MSEYNFRQMLQGNDPAANISAARLARIQQQVMQRLHEPVETAAFLPPQLMRPAGYVRLAVAAVLLLVLGGYAGINLEQLRYADSDYTATSTTNAAEALVRTPWQDLTY